MGYVEGREAHNRWYVRVGFLFSFKYTAPKISSSSLCVVQVTVDNQVYSAYVDTGFRGRGDLC